MGLQYPFQKQACVIQWALAHLAVHRQNGGAVARPERQSLYRPASKMCPTRNHSLHQAAVDRFDADLRGPDASLC